MKNALIPVVTFIALDLGAMLSGAILTETVFNWPGIGYTIFISINAAGLARGHRGDDHRHARLHGDQPGGRHRYAFLDPRIRYGEPKAG